MLDDIASGINAASEDGPVLELRAAVPAQANTLRSTIKDAPSLDLKLQRADAFFASPDLADGSGVSSADEPPVHRPVADTPLSSDDAVPAGQAASAGRRALRYGACAVAIVGLCGLAWAAGAHQFSGRAPVHVVSPELQQGPQHDELASAVRQMGEELRTLAARVDATDAAQKAPATSVQPAAGKDIAELAGRLDDMDAKLNAKLSRLDERLAAVEQRGAASPATEVARVQPPRHHAKHVHDAFDPSRDPSAPGAPHPLGSR